MNGLMALGGVLALLLLAGSAIGLFDRRRFSLRWLLVAALLVAINDASLTLLYGTVPALHLSLPRDHSSVRHNLWMRRDEHHAGTMTGLKTSVELQRQLLIGNGTQNSAVYQIWLGTHA